MRTVIVFMLLSCNAGYCAAHGEGADDRRVVTLQQGKLRGLREAATGGQEFFSFRGIPYAKPPLGRLRFMHPVAADGWEGVLDATRDPEPCLQHKLLDILKKDGSQPFGSEDCLYLNVYTRHPGVSNKPRAVMVYIHGGAFLTSGIFDFPPYVLMNEDIVLVVIQQRLGTFGFLSTADEAAPGNQAMHDQLMSLIWVQKNIAEFGGNPDSVTIFGESAGGVSTHYHILSRKSKGLFHRAIVQSGTALCSVIYTERHREVAFSAGELLGCSAPESAVSSEELVHCLQRAPAEDVAAVYLNLTKWTIFPLVMLPRVDKDFIEDYPVTQMKEGRHHNVDIMIGVTEHEGGYFSPMLYTNNEEKNFNEKFAEIAPLALTLSEVDGGKPVNLARTIFEYYGVKGEVTADDADKITEIFGDRYFNIPNDYVAAHHAKNMGSKGKVYMYELKHRGENSYTDLFNLPFGKHWVSHADDLAILFAGSEKYPELTREEDIQVSRIMAKLWTNFATTGNPTPDGSLGFRWTAVKHDKLQHLVIKPKPYMEDNHRQQVHKFWRSLPLKENLILFPEDFSGASTAAKKERNEEL